MKISSILISSLLVGAAGVIAGTLIAPDKGSRTRDKISRKGREYKTYLQDNFDDITDSVSHPFESPEDETIRLSKKVTEKAKMTKSEID